MFSYHSYHIYGNWRSIKVGGRFLNHQGGKPQRVGTIFMEEVDPSRHQVKIFIWQLEKG